MQIVRNLQVVRNLLLERAYAGLFLPRITSGLYSTDTATAQNITTPAINEIAGEKDKLFSKLEIKLRGVDPAVLKSYASFATTAANHLNIEVGGR